MFDVMTSNHLVTRHTRAFLATHLIGAAFAANEVLPPEVQLSLGGEDADVD